MKFRKQFNWYVKIKKKQRIIIWILSTVYAVIPWTGLFLGGIPWFLILIYLEYHRDPLKHGDSSKWY